MSKALGAVILAASAALIVAGGVASATPGHSHQPAISRDWTITDRHGRGRPTTWACHSFTISRGGRDCVPVITGR
jgi:hypothetical protein